jgi:hypothetical protein
MACGEDDDEYKSRLKLKSPSSWHQSASPSHGAIAIVDMWQAATYEELAIDVQEGSRMARLRGNGRQTGNAAMAGTSRTLVIYTLG